MENLQEHNNTTIIEYFNDKPVRIIGTPGGSFFYARDIAEAIDVKQVSAAIKNFDDNEIVSQETRTRYNLITYRKYKKESRRDDTITLLTQNGVHRLIANSRNVVAEQLRRNLNEKKYYYKSIPEMNFAINIQDSFPGEKIELQKIVLGYRIDMYFMDYKIAIEFDEDHHRGQQAADIQRQNAIEEALTCTFVRATPRDNIFAVIGQIYTLIKNR